MTKTKLKTAEKRLISLSSNWIPIDWPSVRKADKSSLPQAYEIVSVALKTDQPAQFLETRGYWCETYSDDVCFTIDSPDAPGYAEYALENVVAWKCTEKSL